MCLTTNVNDFHDVVAGVDVLYTTMLIACFKCVYLFNGVRHQYIQHIVINRLMEINLLD